LEESERFKWTLLEREEKKSFSPPPPSLSLIYASSSAVWQERFRKPSISAYAM
jgi:hypothetical protein